MAPRDVDYSLYLVTDSTPAILGGRDLVDVVEAALRGGVTVCQYRDKTSDTVRNISCDPFQNLRISPQLCPKSHNIVLFLDWLEPR